MHHLDTDPAREKMRWISNRCSKRIETMINKQIRFLALILALLALGSILLAACTRPGTTPSGSSGGGASSGGGGGGGSEPTVHMDTSNFTTPTVTVPKGQKLKLVDDGAFFHIITNGM